MRAAAGAIALEISIHSSRTGGDAGYCVRQARKEISIHSSRTGGDSKTYLNNV